MTPNQILPEYKPFWPETAVVWGAGATQQLGLPTTYECGRIISKLAGIDESGKFEPGTTLDDRLRNAFEGYKIHPELKERFKELMLLLGDGDGATSQSEFEENLSKATNKATSRLVKKYKLNGPNKAWLQYNLEQLYQNYDWLGVRSLAPYIAREWDRKKQKHGEMILSDLLTVVDQLIDLNLALPSEQLFREPKEESDRTFFIGKNRLPGVKQCLGHLIALIFRVLIQKEPGKIDAGRLKPYQQISELFADLMVDESREYIKHFDPHDRRFYLYSYSLISFNWEPLTIWLIWNAHEKINEDEPKINNNKTLCLFNDNGDGIGIRRLLKKGEKPSDDILAFVMNESICRRVNGERFQKKKPAHVFRIGKTMVPHAGLGWRICQRCGKLFTDFGKELGDVNSTVSFGPDLLPELNQAWEPRTGEEQRRMREGEFGVMQCVFCGSPTYPHDSPLMMQSAIKSGRHYVLEGIFREMGLLIGNARHLVLAGYSLPPDDYLYKVFFQSAMAGKKTSQDSVYCTLVNYDKAYAEDPKMPAWIKGEDIKKYLLTAGKENTTWEVIERVLQLFELDRIRVSLKGIPGVILNRTDVTTPKEAFIDLLYPTECFKEGFPPKRN